MQCKNCRISLPDDALVCPRCQAPLPPRATAAPKRPSAYTVVLRLKDSTTFVLTGKESFLIGRRSETNANPQPDVDLTSWDVYRALSRQHARIHLTSEGAFIEDLHSVNKTVLNGFRLLHNQLYPLQDGDELLLGKLMLWVAVRPDSEAIKP